MVLFYVVSAFLFVQFTYSSFSLRNKRTFAFSEVNLALFIFIIFAAALNTHSDGADVARMFRIHSANIQIKGY